MSWTDWDWSLQSADRTSDQTGIGGAIGLILRTGDQTRGLRRIQGTSTWVSSLKWFEMGSGSSGGRLQADALLRPRDLFQSIGPLAVDAGQWVRSIGPLG